jgi:hypothetical protein
MDRRKFLRDASLLSLAVGFGKEIALPAKAVTGQTGSDCTKVVNIVLHGFMYYQFILEDKAPTGLQIIAPDVTGHAYFFGEVGQNRDASQLQCIKKDMKFPADGLGSGKITQFPSGVPSFSRNKNNNNLGELTANGAHFVLNFPLPSQIFIMTSQPDREFGGNIGKQINKLAHARTVCLQYPIAGAGGLPFWIQNNKANFYAQQPPSTSGKCPKDSKGCHFNHAIVESRVLFTNGKNLDLTGKCGGEECKDIDVLPTCRCTVCADDLRDLCDLMNIPQGCTVPVPPGQPECNERHITTTAGPLCAGFFVTP